MKQHLKDELKRMYEAPETKGKERFLAQQETPGISYGEFLKMQIPYIKKQSWFINLFIFAIALVCLQRVGTQSVWIVSSFVPFLALATVVEGNSSVQYHMAELELASPFSMKMVVAARMLILGVSNIVVLMACFITVGREAEQGLILGGGAIVIPYFLAAFMNLLIVRRVQGRESIYSCFGVSVLIGGMNLILHTMEYSVFEKLGNTGMILIFLAVVVVTAVEFVRFMNQMEELVWN